MDAPSQPTPALTGTPRQLLPLTVWMCPDPDDEQPTASSRFDPCVRHRPNAGRELARHLIATCTHDGDLVAETHPTNDSVLAAAAELGRRAVACAPHFALAQYVASTLRSRSLGGAARGVALRPCRPDQMTRALADHLGTTALVITAPPPDDGDTALRPSRQGRAACPGCSASVTAVRQPPLGEVLLASWRMLRPGGHLAVVTTARHEGGRFIDPAPQIIRQARALGFRYSQHVIAVRVPSSEDGVLVQSSPGDLAQIRDQRATALPPAARVHADVCLFTKPHPTPNDDGRNDREPKGKV
ncbi:hypothetical protein [Actinomadura gamaensis]|uniref:Uncharacterized protein n=1 Tax=Actinomadura gamaensis TaxID=1763541 RepID=A0ABV9U8R2_9ACTN